MFSANFKTIIMKHYRHFLLFITILFSYQNTFSQPSDSSSKAIFGSWVGKLDIPSGEVRIIFVIKKEDDTIKSVIKSPDQSPMSFPADTTILKENFVQIVLTKYHIKFDGNCNWKDTSITGTFVQGAFSESIVLKPFKQNRPQEPHPPFPYISEDVSFKNNIEGITLVGTLTMPSAGGPFPAVVLITGSGPQDRNEEIFGHKPFFVLADYLTRNGIAVLRFDDRGTGKSTGNYARSDANNFANDVVAGIEFLKKNDKIDKSKIGLIGHSEGGMIAPMIASENPDVAFIVMMAGPGIPGDQLLLLQAEKIFKMAKISDDVIALDRKIKLKIFREINKNEDSASTAKKIIGYYSKLSDSSLEKLKIPRDKIKLIIPQFMYPEILALIRYKPADYLKKVKCPVLAIDGERDLQVPAKENLKGIEDAPEGRR